MDLKRDTVLERGEHMLRTVGELRHDPKHLRPSVR